MSGDTVFLLQAFAVGAMITFVYDWLRIVRRVISHKQFMVSLEDLFFWIICAVYVFFWMYRVSNGGMRWFAIAGALAGMYLYKKLLSGLFVTYLSRMLKFVLHILSRFFAILLRPIRYVGRRMSHVQGRFRNKRRKITGNFKIWLKSRIKALKIRLCKR